MLTGVPEINQRQLNAITRATIRSSGNILVFGPSGAGKTFICKDACEEEKCDLIYINLAVLERTDFQGFPIPSTDRKTITYATPEFLPFSDTAEKTRIEALQTLISSTDDKTIQTWADSQIAELTKIQKAKDIRRLAPLVSGATEAVIKRFEKILGEANKTLTNDRDKVIMFDEADKAMTETMQTLLEFLQFHSINGRKLNVRANILTGNLPDEHAHTSQISHAITKRCRTFKLDIDFDIWRDWAFKNDVHDHVIQYLTYEPTMLYQAAPDGDTTAYALPSPRTWTDAAEALTAIDKDDVLKRWPSDKIEELRMKMLAGSVGGIAAAKFGTWYNHYRKYEPAIQDLIENGKHPDKSKLGASDILIMAISAGSKVYAELKPSNEKKIISCTKNVYSWIKTLPEDAQMGAVRLSWCGDWDKCHKYKLPEIPEFRDVFRGIEQKLVENGAQFSGDAK